MESEREERSGEIGSSSGSVPPENQSTSADPDQRDESMIQNFSEPGKGSTSEDQSREKADSDSDEDLWERLLGNRGQSSNNLTKEGLHDKEQSTSEVHSNDPNSINTIIESMDDIPITCTVIQGSNGETSSKEPHIVENVGNDGKSVSTAANDHAINLNNLEIEHLDHAVLFPWWKELTSKEKVEKSTKDEIDIDFKKLGMVEDCIDHHYIVEEQKYKEFMVDEPSREWVQKIQHEWKLLKADLPETIFCQVYEKRMDLLRAVIIGPPGTPYHNGLFFFDCLFPSTYPDMPPLVHYVSHDLELNPNLHADGKVCISLLGMWSEHAWERWNPKESTMLQVLVSIQALVLNSEPFFNHSDVEDLKNTTRGSKESDRYNEKIYFFSGKTMVFTIQNPPKNFEGFVAEYFRKRGKDILIACRAYCNGVKVGTEIEVNGPEVDRIIKSKPPQFNIVLELLFEELLEEFAKKGADCCLFLPKGQP